MKLILAEPFKHLWAGRDAFDAVEALQGEVYRELEGRRTLRKITPAVESAQRIMLRGLSAKEGDELMRLLRKAIAAGNDLSRAPLRDTQA